MGSQRPTINFHFASIMLFVGAFQTGARKTNGPENLLRKKKITDRNLCAIETRGEWFKSFFGRSLIMPRGGLESIIS
jgi:hypothetical protein